MKVNKVASISTNTKIVEIYDHHEYLPTGTHSSQISMSICIRAGLDIGGTLAKVVCVAPSELLQSVSSRFSNAVMIHEKTIKEEHDILPADIAAELGCQPLPMEFAMFSFSSRDISSLLDFLRELFAPIHNDHFRLPVTGGGAIKFRTELSALFPRVEVVKVDEMDALCTGFTFLVRRVNSAFVFHSETKLVFPVPVDEVTDPFPLLLVNVGSGVSFIKISGAGDYRRVSGTPIGGGTVMGLGKCLFKNSKNFNEIIKLSKNGKSESIDLSIQELIGTGGQDQPTNWNSDTLAASMTKLSPQAKQEDVAKSLVRMVSYNIGYIAYLVSLIHSCKRIYFSGKFINKHEPTMEAISYAVKFYQNWEPPDADSSPGHKPQSKSLSSNQVDVRFLHHEGYVGAIGALLASIRNP
jgi:type II pantothenate kinase